MRNLQVQGICLLFIFISVHSWAQHTVPINEPDLNKPRLFANLPDKIPVDVNSLLSLVNSDMGRNVSLKLDQAIFTGQVISKADDHLIRSVTIRSGNFNGATLTLSSSVLSNGAVKYTGRIISFQHGDVYELQNQNDQYILTKKNFYDLINE